MIIHTLSRLSLVVLRITVVLGLAGLCTFIHLHDSTLLDSITEMIKHHPIAYTLFRWSLMCGFILFWPQIVLKIGQHSGTTPDQIFYWCQKRAQIALWLILIELLVCENLISKTMHWFGNL